MPTSSSTIRMLCMSSGFHGRFCGDRQLHYKLCPDWFVFFDADGAVMLFDDAANDGQSKASSTLFRREIRKEEFFFDVRRDAMAAVGDYDLHHVAAAKDGRRYLNFPDHRFTHGFGGVVDKVRECTLQRIG